VAAYEDAVRKSDCGTQLELAETSDHADARVRSKAVEENRTRRRGARPPIPRGRPIQEYQRSRLVQLVRWIESDEILRTEDELLAETMKELGFKRRGSRVVSALEAAIRQARS